MKENKTCYDCVKRLRCWERSRDYPCRSFEDMYKPAKKPKKKGENHE